MTADDALAEWRRQYEGLLLSDDPEVRRSAAFKSVGFLAAAVRRVGGAGGSFKRFQELYESRLESDDAQERLDAAMMSVGMLCAALELLADVLSSLEPTHGT